jgi:hypothetical protein
MPTPTHTPDLTASTPLTSDAIHRYWNGGSWSPEFANFTRQIERENAALRAALELALAYFDKTAPESGRAVAARAALSGSARDREVQS